MVLARRILQLFWTLLGSVSLVIGVGGIPSAIQQWATWLGPLDSDLGRWVAGVLGVFILANSLQLVEVVRVVFGRPQTVTGSVQHPAVPTGRAPSVNQRLIPREVPATTQRAMPPPGDGITPQYLANLHWDHTIVQTTDLINSYKGQWITVEGTLGEVMPVASVGVLVTLDSIRSPSVPMWFREIWLDRLKLLNRGSLVRARGQLKDASAATVTLENCELLES